MADNKPVRSGPKFKFTDPKEVRRKIEAYFASRDQHTEKRLMENGRDKNGNPRFEVMEALVEAKPYAISGVALALDTNRTTLLEYQDVDHYTDEISDEIRDELINTIMWAKAKCETNVEQFALDPDNKNARGAIFNLANNYSRNSNGNWSEKQEVDHTTKGEKLPAPLVYLPTDLPENIVDAPAEEPVV